VFQIVDFSSISDLKFTYVHLQFQKNSFRGYNPRTPMIKGREGKRGEGRKGGKERRGRKEGRGGEQRKGCDGVNPPKTNPGYGPV
jgi:hypothetical protein